MPEHLYWSILVLALGGCIGSFLNVVIYRLPRGLSIHRPLWSFCPACERPIAWYDNVPVFSYLMLGGRCRRCRSPISLQYPLVELATALIFLMLFDAMFVARLREGVGQLTTDWPILLAHLVLLGGLIALAVMDLEAYMVDIRVTWVVAAAGIIAHTLWTPASSLARITSLTSEFIPAGCGGWIRPGPIQAAVALAATIGLALGTWRFLRDLPAPPVEDDEPTDDGHEIPPTPAVGPRRRRPWAALVVAVLFLLVIAYVVLMARNGQQVPPGWLDLRADQSAGWHPAMLRLACGLGLCFVGLALVASCPQPQADAEIIEAIDAEAVDARHNALWELKLLAPAIILAAAAGIGLCWVGDASWPRIEAILHWQPLPAAVGAGWQPLWGLATGLSGWILGGAIGWLARIVFTLAFGKEALGMGDVHILAAAGAVAGWPVALIGFFLAAPLALLAIVVIALRRQSRALPYGPWLALAFFMVCLFQDAILRYLRIRWLVE